MRFQLKHPKTRRTRAHYGRDHSIGYFVEIRQGERLVEEYDRLHKGYDELNGALRFLVRHGLLTEADLGLAAGLVAAVGSQQIEDPGVRRAAEVIENLQRA
jgi:hypothetical protein